MKSKLIGMALAATTLLASQAPADESPPKLINLDTTTLQPKGSLFFKADARFFGNEESAFYGGLELIYGLGGGIDLDIRGATTKFRNYIVPGAFTIRHGGSDLEAMVRAHYMFLNSGDRVMGGVGISIPNTPAQDQPFLTAEAIYGHNAQGVNFFIGPRGVFKSDRSILGIGAGFDANVGKSFHVIGDLTGIVAGRNTISVNSAQYQRAWIYGLGVSYTHAGLGSFYTLDAGVTNGTGPTTGFSLTPSLGRSVGLFLGLTIHY